MVIVIDHDEMRIIEYADRYMAALPKAQRPYGPKQKPINIVQSEGPGFKIKDHTIKSVLTLCS